MINSAARRQGCRVALRALCPARYGPDAEARSSWGCLVVGSRMRSVPFRVGLRVGWGASWAHSVNGPFDPPTDGPFALGLFDISPQTSGLTRWRGQTRVSV